VSRRSAEYYDPDAYGHPRPAQRTEEHQMTALTRAQLQQLLAPIDPGRVQRLNGQSHLEAWDVRRWLIRIFGFAGWDFEERSVTLVHERLTEVNGKTRATVVYRVAGRLIIKDADGNEFGHWDDGACGNSVNQPSVGDAHDMALKTAYSQALKRCAMNLGDQFGLSLYDNGSTNAVVVKTIAGAEQPVTMPQDPPVMAASEPAVPDPEADRPAKRSRKQTDDEWTLPKIPRATMNQVREIAQALGFVRGLTDEDEMTAAVSEMVKRGLEDPSELTAAEARTILLELQVEHEAKGVLPEKAGQDGPVKGAIGGIPPVPGL
jgi:hypothetical protein